jgi:hypothetical protein
VSRPRIAAALVVGCLLLTGCATNINVGDGGPPPPRCSQPGRLVAGTVLAAQAVPSAKLIPCIRAIAAGWLFERLDARNGQAQMFFNAGGNETHQLTITLRQSCSLGSAAERPSDHAGTREFDGVTRTTSDFTGDRHYVFDGGCATYHFNAHGSTVVALVDALLHGLGFQTRQAVAQMVRDLSSGQLELDPKPSGK